MDLAVESSLTLPYGEDLQLNISGFVVSGTVGFPPKNSIPSSDCLLDILS